MTGAIRVIVSEAGGIFQHVFLFYYKTIYVDYFLA